MIDKLTKQFPKIGMSNIGVSGFEAVGQESDLLFFF